MFSRMFPSVLCFAVFLASALNPTAAQTSCKGRCGAEYYRGYMCQCDYTCLSYGECCSDFESQCTTKNSCKGRCGEAFKRGRLCSCDADCFKYKQCCPDHKLHCDAEEGVSGAASVAAPAMGSSCNNVNDNKPSGKFELAKEETVTDATEPPFEFSEGNNADDYMIPLDSPTSYTHDDLSDDMYGQVFPNDDFSNSGPEDLDASPVPESISGYESSPANHHVFTEQTLDKDALEFSTEAVTDFSQTQMTPSHHDPTPPSSSTHSVASGDAHTDSTDDSILSETTTSVQQDVSHRTSPPVAHTERTSTASTAEKQTLKPIGAFTDKPEVTSSASVSSGLPQDSSTILENVPTSTTLVPPPIQEATASNPKPDAVNNAEDITTGPSSSPPDDQNRPVGSEPDGVTTPVSSATSAPEGHTADDITPAETTADPRREHDSPPTEPPPKPQKPVEVLPTKPTLSKSTSKPETKPAQTPNIDDTRDYQADHNNDTNLCSGRPVAAVATLRNGTIVVFRGHYFWLLDRNRVPGPAQGITQVWGVPSPIDTAFTRCNCQGKTYIFQGSRYWRFENDALDLGYPKAIQIGFDGLRGHITAALSVPQYRSMRESVYFFKRGGFVQKYSYQFGTTPTCNKKPQSTIYTVHNRLARQAASRLGAPINIRTTWRGFPSTITAAVSVPSRREPQGYKYYVFSRSKSYNVRMDSERPFVAPRKANTSPHSNEVFKCPRKV